MNYRIRHLETDFAVSEINSAFWQSAAAVGIDLYWSGETAPAERHFEARLLWSETSLYVRFETSHDEPLVVSPTPDLTAKTIGLWDRDVCEIFVAPNANEKERYFEFEIAPTGEWIDLAIHQMPDRRETDWDYASGMTSHAAIQDGKILMSIRIPWEAFAAKPTVGDFWFGNIYRCVGAGETRGYLAWSPTLTPEPAFHVPEKFGRFEFVR